MARRTWLRRIGANLDVDHNGLDVLGEHVHGPDGEHQARDLRLHGEQLVRVDADWQLDEFLSTLQVEDIDARQDLLDVQLFAAVQV